MILDFALLQIRSNQALEKLPAEINMELPLDITRTLIRRRPATPIADVNTMLDAVLTTDYLQYSRIETDPKWLATNITACRDCC
jgi:hypothetical protein